MILYKLTKCKRPIRKYSIEHKTNNNYKFKINLCCNIQLSEIYINTVILKDSPCVMI